MQKEIIISTAIAGVLALTGCGNTTETAATSQPKAQQAPAATATAAITADSIAAKLTAAGFKFTTKDKTAGAKAGTHGSAVLKSTEFNIPVEGDKVVLSVTELSDASQKIAVESDIRMSFIKATEADANIKAVMAKMDSQTTLVAVIYKIANEKDAWKIEDAIGAQ